jgi:hypothetical protein
VVRRRLEAFGRAFLQRDDVAQERCI